MKLRFSRPDANTVVLLKQIGIGLVVIATLALLLSGIWYGSRLVSLTVTDISVEGGETILHDGVVMLAQQELEGTYLGFIPRRFAWLYPKRSIHDVIKSTERVHNVTVDRVSGTKIHISFDEYVPFALWCASVEEGDCLFVDKTGFAFTKAPKLTGGSFLRFIKSNKSPTVGEFVSEGEDFASLQLLSTLLAQHSWFVSFVEIDQVGDVFLQIVGGGELKVSTKETPHQTVENFLTVLASDEFTHLRPGNFKYVDLRFGNKVFVNEELDVPEEELANDEVVEEQDMAGATEAENDQF